jgi:acetyltransferase
MLYDDHIRRALASAATPTAAHEGAALVVRPIGPRDKCALAAFFVALSPLSRHRRFLTSKPALSARELTYFTEVDHRRHEGLVAQERGGRLVGVGQYAAWPNDLAAGDLAIAIADDYQGQGLGTSLAFDLVQRARANGLRRLTASTQPQNLASQRMLRRVGFAVTGGDEEVVELELAL